MTPPIAYEADFHAWALEQAALLRAGRLSEIDIGHIADELESLGKGERRELIRQVRAVISHMLVGHFGADGWDDLRHAELSNRRLDLVDLLKDNPSLRQEMAAVIQDAYRRSRDTVRLDGVPADDLPADCPWTLNEILGAETAGGPT